MSIKISLNNAGGELDCRIVETEEETVPALIELLEELSELQPGDTVVVTEIQ